MCHYCEHRLSIFIQNLVSNFGYITVEIEQLIFWTLLGLKILLSWRAILWIIIRRKN